MRYGSASVGFACTAGHDKLPEAGSIDMGEDPSRSANCRIYFFKACHFTGNNDIANSLPWKENDLL